MRKFIFKIFIFFITSYVFIYCLGAIFSFLINKSGKNFLNNADYKVTEAIIKSRQHKKTKKLIIGDSVGASLYSNDNNENVISLATTVALTTVGQYCLMANFIENNRNNPPEEVILIYNPICWNNTLEGPLAYSCFAKNFYNDEFMSYLDEKEITYISKWPYAKLLNQKWFALSPVSYSAIENLPKGEYISPQQYRYLKKMISLCLDKNIKFSMYSGPVRESLKNQIEKSFKGKEHTNEPIFQDYYSSIKYMPDSCFIDQLHLKKEFIPTDYLNLY